MPSIDHRLIELGIILPDVHPPSGAYVPGVLHRGLLYCSGQTWKSGGRQEAIGLVGQDLTVEEAQLAARHCALACLAEARAVLGTLDTITRVVSVRGYVRSAAGFGEQPRVVDGASKLLMEVFGDRGAHARTSIGVAELPGGAGVELDVVLAVDG